MGLEQYQDSLRRPPYVRMYNGRTSKMLNESSKVRADEYPVICRQFDSETALLAYRGITLVPTPETDYLAKVAAKWWGERGGIAVDVGTGSGLIALRLWQNLPLNGQVVATDLDGRCLEVARLNMLMNGVEEGQINTKFHLMQADVLSGLRRQFGRVDMIVSNPPFFPTNCFRENDFEPRMAFDGGGEGMDFYGRLFAEAKEVLSDVGILVVQVQEMRLEQVLAQVNVHLPGMSRKYVTNVANGKVCGLVLGDEAVLQSFVAS